MSYRNKKLLRAAKGRPCVLCGKTGTTVAAHANSVSLGKGTGIKAPDYYVAYVCRQHHDQIDGHIKFDCPYTSALEMWLWAFTKTVELWFKEGLVVVK